MAKSKATKTKTKTVKARVAVVYGDTGVYQAGGYRSNTVRHPNDEALVDDAYDLAPEARKAYPHTCLIDVELPIPKPPEGKVVKVKAVKP